MAKFISKETALRLGREHWIWRKNNPKMEPRDWPGWAEISHMPSYLSSSSCTCCIYVAQRVKVKGEGLEYRHCIRYCPLIHLWVPISYGSPCCGVGSPYNKWRNSRPSSALAQKEADNIIAGHTAALEKLYKGGKHDRRTKTTKTASRDTNRHIRRNG